MLQDTYKMYAISNTVLSQYKKNNNKKININILNYAIYKTNRSIPAYSYTNSPTVRKILQAMYQ